MEDGVPKAQMKAFQEIRIRQPEKHANACNGAESMKDLSYRRGVVPTVRVPRTQRCIDILASSNRTPGAPPGLVDAGRARPSVRHHPDRSPLKFMRVRSRVLP